MIALTSSQAEEDIVKSDEPRANAYMTKPVDPSEFIDTVQKSEDFWFEGVRLPPVEREYE
ncbi:response regulator receiver protein [Halorubrum aidingense JCM 13560]|uniref:Response regulator receiver protein n=1 Tax=Halorubrum aidingense JCM 13560 TaxID=1230454 RepID=M0PPD8_9EURY|nr:response regulator receiver protein [Halorubrum aidingense JCM 13560]